MLNSLRFSAYRTAMSLFTLLSFRFQAVTPLGLPGDGAVGFRPFAEVFPDMQIPGLYQASDFPEDESSRLRRIALSARLIGVVGRIAPASTPPVPEGEQPFIATVYPRLMRMAWPSPPAVPARMRPSEGVGPDLLAELAADGPFGSCLRVATSDEAAMGAQYVIDLDWMLGYRTFPGLLAPGGKAFLARDGDSLRTVGLSRAGDPLPLASWRGRQIERDALLAAMNEDLTTVRHNAFVHLATLTPFALATINQMRGDHPVRRLLHHCFHTVLIGNRELGELQLGGPRGFAATIFSHAHVEVARMIGDRLVGYDFWDFEPETQFARRGTTTTPFAYPYRDNVMELWSTTLAYVRRYLALYYDDAAVGADLQVSAWLDELDRLLPNGLGVRNQVTVDWIARVCATVIHVSTVEHDVLNNVTWNYSTLGWLVPTVAPVTGERMDQRRAFDLISTLVGTWKPYNMLLTADVPELALDPAARAVMQAWIDDLTRIQAAMGAKGHEPSLSYPSNLNVSISN